MTTFGGLSTSSDAFTPLVGTTNVPVVVVTYGRPRAADPTPMSASPAPDP
jgi:hypothetical protein